MCVTVVSVVKVNTLKKIKALFWKKRVFVFDLDGTLYLGKKIIPGALDLLWELKRQNKSFFYLTNNSSRSEKDYLTKLTRMGFPVRPQQIIMSTHLLISELIKKRWKKVFVLGTPSMKQMLRKKGIVHSEKSVQAVVVGFDKTLTYSKLEAACRFVQKNVPYVITHPDLYCPTEKGPEPDCGAFGQMIELVTNKKPTLVLGKPHPRMLGEVLKREQFKKNEVVIVGDRLTTDIEMAAHSGVESILVLSGETQRGDLRKHHARTKIRTRNILPSVKELL